MGKHLKFNIKNLQLAGALKTKKPENEESELPAKKASAEAVKARPSRLKEDAQVSSALKQAEKC